MKISDFDNYQNKFGICSLVGDYEFKRLSRITSRFDCPVCVYIAQKKYLSQISDNVSMVITTSDIADSLKGNSYGICIATNPKKTFFMLFEEIAKLDKKNYQPKIIGKGCSISSLSCIAENNVKIGDNVVIEDFVTIRENVIIGNNVVIRAGSRIGMPDFNYYMGDVGLKQLPHQGTVLIGDNVDIGCNTVIGQALYPNDLTIIGTGCKIDSGAIIGHDCNIGENSSIYAGCVIGGYVTVGSDTRITMCSVIKNALNIGGNVTVGMGSVVIADVKDGLMVFGNPARKLNV